MISSNENARVESLTLLHNHKVRRLESLLDRIQVALDEAITSQEFEDEVREIMNDR
jgi:hypothetical protein